MEMTRGHFWTTLGSMFCSLRAHLSHTQMKMVKNSNNLSFSTLGTKKGKKRNKNVPFL